MSVLAEVCVITFVVMCCGLVVVVLRQIHLAAQQRKHRSESKGAMFKEHFRVVLFEGEEESTLKHESLHCVPEVVGPTDVRSLTVGTERA